MAGETAAERWPERDGNSTAEVIASGHRWREDRVRMMVLDAVDAEGDDGTWGR